MQKRNYIRRVPRNLLSKKFLNLSTAKKIAVMRTMRQKAAALITATEKLGTDVKAYSVDCFEEKDLSVLKRKRDEFLERRKQIWEGKYELAVLCGEYFVKRGQMTSVINTNPITLGLHKTEDLLHEFGAYFGDIQDAVMIMGRKR